MKCNNYNNNNNNLILIFNSSCRVDSNDSDIKGAVS